ncbi:MAG: efflux RND transporter periplasmic adaptor subunit [Gammaproteobacteria bacterium]|jgi:RND family efflux transporter MFP subunit|nr:efflux RND transporter periplasmic adaptor subunit [Gammaproteobacteria bacterium]MBT5202059.1 efflux RND transporter periplasmic adaptor subunit [Gammaproteobacteria bacterium]MBT5603049.1 efflux RND transporter periplasmic adaptor subunit [Gammaproteobacteria bacterium]
MIKLKQKLLPLGIIMVGFAIAAILVMTGPSLEPVVPAIVPPIVETKVAMPANVQMTALTHGTVRPRSQTDLIAEVSGRVIALSDDLVSGGFFNKGQVLFSIDALDYQVALEQAKAGQARAVSELANASKAYARQQDLAKRQSASESQHDDALNRLKVAEATRREARAWVAKATRDMARTKVTAPYDGRVRSEQLDIGQFVNRGVSVATIYATDFVEVRLPIHDEELAFLDLPLSTSGKNLDGQVITRLRARFAGEEHEWEGTIVRTEGEIDAKTRMIQLVARVADPYAALNGKPPLAVGLFVEAEILGKALPAVVILPREAIRSNDQVYIVNSQNRLELRQLEIVKRVGNQVYVAAGLTRGDLVCITNLNDAIPGMLVRTASEPVYPL